MPGACHGPVRVGRLDRPSQLANLANVITVNMHEAKSRLSELVRMVEAGEQVVLARNGTPVVEIVPAAEPAKRQGGIWKGKAWISPDFDAPMPELEDLIYGD